jgi:hypothetical protein
MDILAASREVGSYRGAAAMCGTTHKTVRWWWSRIMRAVRPGELHMALHWHWASNSGPYAQQVPMIIEAGAAAVIAVTAHSPFGETERAAGRWLPYLRLFAAVGMCGLAIALLQLGAAGESLNEGVLVLARNLIGITGVGLLCSLVTGGLLAWTLPMGYMVFCQYALLEAWIAPWTCPPARRPRRLDLRLRGLRGRPALVHHPRSPYPPQRGQLGNSTDIHCDGAGVVSAAVGITVGCRSVAAGAVRRGVPRCSGSGRPAG